jgi:hypothetical protein
MMNLIFVTIDKGVVNLNNVIYFNKKDYISLSFFKTIKNCDTIGTYTIHYLLEGRDVITSIFSSRDIYDRLTTLRIKRFN